MKKTNCITRCILAILVCLFTWHQLEAKNTSTVSINVKNESLQKVLKEIERQSDYRFSYKQSDLKNAATITVSLKNVAVKTALDRILQNSGLTYEIISTKSIVIVPRRDRDKDIAEASYFPNQDIDASHSKTVSGTVLDKDGEPVIGASVQCDNDKKIGTTTDANGKYSFKVPNNTKRLHISYIGMIPQTVKAVDNESVTLAEAANKLDEVVVVGFGTQKKINLTGSVSQVTSEALESRPIQNVSQALQGLVPGMNFSVGADGGMLNNTPSVSIRGAGTIGTGSTASPLVLIDGVEGNMNSLNPDDIDNISVLKDAAASSIYGSRAPFGVILITTKQGKKGKPSINYSNNFRFNSPINQPEFMDAYSFVNYFNAAKTNAGQTAQFNQDMIDRIVAYNNGEMGFYVPIVTATGKWDANYGNITTDWYKVHYKDRALSQTHNISLSGATDRVNYYLSGSFMGQEGLLKYADDSYYRYNITGKITVNVNSILKVAYSNKWINTDYNAPPTLAAFFSITSCVPGPHA